MLHNEQPSRDDELPAGADGFRAAPAANSIGALCYSWVKALDPTGRSQDLVPLPAAGYVERVDAQIAARGLCKAAAGTKATLTRVVGLGGDLGRAHVALRPCQPVNSPAAGGESRCGSG